MFIPSQSAVPEVDPDMTVMISRSGIGKPQVTRAAIPELDDWHLGIEAAADEAAKAKAAAQLIAAEITPDELPLDIAGPVAVHRPGSWANSSAVNNPDLTVIAGGVVTQNAKAAKAAKIDLASITEPTIIVQTGDSAGTLMQLSSEQTEWSISSGADRCLQVTQLGVSTN
ncbi:MAG: hypothetical protein ACJAZF_004361, partial [Granulosicoccus sp.]